MCIFEPPLKKFGADEESMIGLLIYGDTSVGKYVKGGNLSTTSSNGDLKLMTRRQKRLNYDYSQFGLILNLDTARSAPSFLTFCGYLTATSLKVVYFVRLILVTKQKININQPPVTRSGARIKDRSIIEEQDKEHCSPIIEILVVVSFRNR